MRNFIVLLQSRKICCLEVQVVEKKKKKGKKSLSSEIISPAIFKSWCANIMKAINAGIKRKNANKCKKMRTALQ